MPGVSVVTRIGIVPNVEGAGSPSQMLLSMLWVKNGMEIAFAAW